MKRVGKLVKDRVVSAIATWVLAVAVFAPIAKGDAVVTAIIAPVGAVENASGVSVATPGPATLLLLGSGLMGLAGAVQLTSSAPYPGHRVSIDQFVPVVFERRSLLPRASGVLVFCRAALRFFRPFF